MSLATNAGHKMIAMEATAPGHGTTWCDDKALANIFSFADLVDKPDTLHIKCDSDKEDAFLVCTKNTGIAKFSQTPEGLCAFCPLDQFCRSGMNKQKEKQLLTAAKLDASTCEVVGICNLIDAVEENWMGFSK